MYRRSRPVVISQKSKKQQQSTAHDRKMFASSTKDARSRVVLHHQVKCKIEALSSHQLLHCSIGDLRKNDDNNNQASSDRISIFTTLSSNKVNEPFFLFKRLLTTAMSVSYRFQQPLSLPFHMDF